MAESDPPVLDYLLQIQLLKTSNPCVQRTLRVPAKSPFYLLQLAILEAFSWDRKELFSWSFTVVLRDPMTAALISENPRALLEIVTGHKYPPKTQQNGDVLKLSDVLDCFRYCERPLLFIPEPNGATFCINVLGRMAPNLAAGFGCIGGQGTTYYEDWDPRDGGRSSWNLDHEALRKRIGLFNNRFLCLPQI